MRYADFLEEAYASLRVSAPPVPDGAHFPAWLRSIGTILHGLPKDLADYWIEQYATLLIVKYPHIPPNLAHVYLRHGVTEAQAAWPRHLPVMGG